jgi:PAS domain S-box-containing protein
LELPGVEGRPIDVVFNLIDSSTGKKAEIPVERVFREGRIVGLANHSAIISRQGVERQIADSAAPIRNSKGVIIGSVLVFRDVTEEYAMRDALKRSEMRFRLLAELAKDVIYRMSVPSGVLEYTSPAITELTGFTQEEAAAPGFLRKVVFKADLDVFETAVREAFAGHPQPYTEFRVVRKDGRTVWLSTRTNCIKDPTGRIIALQGSATDISSRKAVEEALAKSESLYRGLVDNIDMGILLYDTGHRVVMVNKYVAAKMGRDVSFFIGRTCYEIFHSSDVVCPHCPCEKARLSGMPESSEFDYEEPDGEWRRFHARAIPLKEKDGSISHFIEVIEDITAQSKSEERKSHLEQQLLQSQKMDSLGRLAGGIAHDFNNMLTPVIGYSDMLLKKGGSLDDPKARRKLEQILAAGNKARDLTRQLLAMGRKQLFRCVISTSTGSSANSSACSSGPSGRTSR